MMQSVSPEYYEWPAGRPQPLQIWRRRALTIVETMVSLSVISFLAALLIPALQIVRESARRDYCLNNLHQIVHACESHESARREFPYTAVQFVGKDNRMHPPCSPHERLLPYLEQEQVFNRVDFNDLPIDLAGKPPSTLRNTGLVSLALSVFRCPSDLALTGGNNYRACMGFGPGISNAAETKQCADPGNGTGAFVNGRATQPAEFTDGLSNTVMLSERVIGSRGAYRPDADYLVSLPDICTSADAIATCSALVGGLPDVYGGSTWLFGGWRQTWYNHILAPNSPIPDCNAGPVTAGGGRGIYTARSYHSGGVNSAMADGSVHFVSRDIDRVVWRAISTRSGGEAIGL